jgi:hypothetical protein
MLKSVEPEDADVVELVGTKPLEVGWRRLLKEIEPHVEKEWDRTAHGVAPDHSPHVHPDRLAREPAVEVNRVEMFKAD